MIPLVLPHEMLTEWTWNLKNKALLVNLVIVGEVTAALQHFSENVVR